MTKDRREDVAGQFPLRGLEGRKPAARLGWQAASRWTAASTESNSVASAADRARISSGAIVSGTAIGPSRTTVSVAERNSRARLEPIVSLLLSARERASCNGTAR